MQRHREQIGIPPGQTFRLLRWTQSISAVQLLNVNGRFERIRGFGNQWHYHRESELTVIEEGAGTRFVADSIQSFDSGDMVLIGPNVPHYWHTQRSCTGWSLQWDLPREHGVWSFGEFSEALHGLETVARHGLVVRRPHRDELCALLHSMQHATSTRRLARFFDVLMTLAEAPKDDTTLLSQRPFAVEGTAEQQDAIRRAVSFLLSHFREEVRLADLLDLTAMSRATFARQFRKHSGKSFSDFLNQVRLQAACRFLRETDDPVSTIALSNGFNEVTFFNRLFRREIGMTPREFRKAGKAKESQQVSGIR